MSSAVYTLAKLVSDLSLATKIVRDVPIRLLTQDSRKVKSDSVFFAVQGSGQDGHHFLMSVLEKKPVAIVVADDVETRSGISLAQLESSTRVLRVHDVKLAFATALNVFWGMPTDSAFLIGVTGTNGKTTTTYLLEYLFSQIGCAVAVMGTINHHLGANVWETSLTTPGLEELYPRLAEFRSAGANVIAMEVSSHALHQGRVLGLQFDAAIFTNLTRDHLDYHKTMADYHLAKQILFTDNFAASAKLDLAAVLNVDDSLVAKTQIHPRAEIIKFAGASSKAATVRFEIEKRGIEGFEFAFLFPDFSIKGVRTQMVGDFNAENITAAVAVLDFYLRKHRPKNRRADLESALNKLIHFSGVRGRLQRVPNTLGFHIFVDYAHTDDALKNVLQTLRSSRDSQISSVGKLRVVFGCGGDRDCGKRPLMAAIACTFADEVIITSDNPRTEDAMVIIGDILEGVPNASADHVTVEPDRARAIQVAISHMKPNDILLVAGKGHETYQIIGQETRHFDDVEQITERLNAHAQTT